MDSWLDVGALWRVLVFGLVAGAGLPILFAVGVRAQAVGTGDGPHSQVAARPLATVVAYACYALVAVAVVAGVLFVARDFLGEHTGWYILGAEAK
jgi:hypothetical protein